MNQGQVRARSEIGWESLDPDGEPYRVGGSPNQYATNSLILVVN